MLLNNDINESYWTTRPNIPEAIKTQVTPCLLPYDHPAREILDKIYHPSSSAEKELYASGRQTKVIKHPELLNNCGLVIKEPRITENGKYSRQLRRVQGHIAGCDLVEKKKLTHVKVTKSWLYPLPGAANDFASSVYDLALPVRNILNALSITSPRWLKYGDTILRDRFVIVEEFIEIQPLNYKRLKALPKEITDQWNEVFETVGFQDAHKDNYSLDKNGKITLFDLDQHSKKADKNSRLGKLGSWMIFPERYNHPNPNI